jgi:arsenate reductase (thioredoxin)
MTKTEPENQSPAGDALPGNTARPVRVLFICTHNSARSRIAEGYLRQQYGYLFDVGSAGTDPRPVHPMAVTVMQEIGIDISRNRSRHLDEFREWEPDIVVSVCDRAKQACPFFPGVHARIHAGFIDPTECTGTPDECLARFRQVRDAIITWIDTIFVPDCGTGREGTSRLAGIALNTGGNPVPAGPSLSEIHQAANGEVYRVVRACDLDLIRDK